MSKYKANLNFGVWPFVRTWILFLLISSLVVCTAAAELSELATHPPRVLLLDNCDSNYKFPPFNDKVLFLDSKGEIITYITGLNVCQNIGGNRAISVSEDGRFFVVCENVADKITAYDLSTGEQMWSLPGKYRSAAIAKDVTYVLGSSEDSRVYKDKILTLDNKGNITKQSIEVQAFDIVVDAEANSVWLAGKDIKKCNMDLQVVQTIDPIEWYAVSIDCGTDGSVWVVERRHSDVGESQNKLLNISPKCEVLQNVPLNDLCPMCVRVNKSDGSVWVTGKSLRIRSNLSFRKWPPSWEKTTQYIGPRTHKYSSAGKLLLEIERGGHSIGIDRSDGSVWIADQTSLLHYSSEGKKLHTCDNVSKDQKWIAIAR